MADEMKTCPYCKEKIPADALVCDFCGEKQKVKRNIQIKLTTIVLILMGIVLAINSVFLIISHQSSNTVSEDSRVILRRVYGGLFTAVSQSKEPCNTSEKIRETIKKSDYLNNVLTSNSAIVAQINDLNSTCELAPQNSKDVSKHNACAEIVIDVNGDMKPNKYGKDRFYFYAYKDGVRTIKDSIEDKAIWKLK